MPRISRRTFEKRHVPYVDSSCVTSLVVFKFARLILINCKFDAFRSVEILGLHERNNVRDSRRTIRVDFDRTLPRTIRKTRSVSTGGEENALEGKRASCQSQSGLLSYCYCYFYDNSTAIADPFSDSRASANSHSHAKQRNYAIRKTVIAHMAGDK